MMKNRDSAGDRLFLAACYIILTFMAVIMLYPFWDLFILSISPKSEALKVGWRLYTRSPELTAYLQVLQSPDIWRSAFNSVIRVVAGTAVGIILTAMTAYPLSKKTFVLNRTFTFIILFTMLFSGGLIPSYMLMKGLNLIDNFLVLILPSAVTAYNLIIVRNFLRSLPVSLEESAKIDGASDFVVWWRVYMPLSLPVLATVALWMAVGHWNAYFDALIYINDRTKYVLQIILRRVLIEQQEDMFITGTMMDMGAKPTSETQKAALIMISTLPIILLYPFLQKYFVRGIVLGAVKE